MKFAAVLFAFGLLTTPAVHAQLYGQDRPNEDAVRAGQALGSLVFRNRAADREADREAFIRHAEAQRSFAELQNAHAQRRLVELEIQLREELTEYWQHLGLGEAEAKSVAGAYELRNEQLAFNERARREGQTATIDAAVKAYKEFEYLRANQLLIAGARIPPAR